MITITVTQDDINKGERLSCFKCPIALAALRAINYSEVVDVDESEIAFLSSNKRRYLPPEAAAFVRLFDGSPRTHPGIIPFSFEIEDLD